MDEGVFTHGVEVEVELVCVNTSQMLVDPVEVLQGQTEVVLAEVGLAHLHFVPHLLHIVNVQFVVVLREREDHLFHLRDLVDLHLIPSGSLVEEAIGCVQLTAFVV